MWLRGTYQTLMLPMLQALSDGRQRRVVPEITAVLAARFELTDADIE